MANDPIIEPPRATRQTDRSHAIVCEFCECKLSLRGRVLWRSEKAKAILDLDEEADRLRKRVALLETEIVTLKQAPVPTVEPPVPAARHRSWAIGE